MVGGRHARCPSCAVLPQLVTSDSEGRRRRQAGVPVRGIRRKPEPRKSDPRGLTADFQAAQNDGEVGEATTIVLHVIDITSGNDTQTRA